MYIEFRNVSKVIGKSKVIDNINYRFDTGKVYGLSGKNGAGKTMLMRLMCGLIRPSSGEVDIDGEILGKNISFPPSVGVLIENPAFLPNYTGFKNLKLISDIRDCVSSEEIKSIMTMVGLDPYDKRQYRKYSLGMKQKLGVACAFLGNPNIVILDEPINALDEQSVPLIHELIDKHKEDSIIIVACHDKEELRSLSDTVIYLDSGKILREEDTV